MKKLAPRILTTPATLLEDVPYPIFRPVLQLAQRMFSRLPELSVTEIQDQRVGEKICLYLHLNGYSDVRLINYTAWGREVPSVRFEFRRIDHLPAHVRDRLTYQTSSVHLIILREHNFDEVMSMAENYLNSVRPQVVSGSLQDGSLPERLAIEALRHLNIGPMMRNTALAEVRELIGRKVRFDQWLPKLGTNGVAVKVDGPHHYVNIEGRSKVEKVQQDDADKDEACRRLGIGLVRIGAYGRDCAIQAPMPELVRRLSRALDDAAKTTREPVRI